ncbi:MAG: methyl-accepting chemotaxis protein [Desulfobacteraceae bacterium]|nr:methyl-accepting chemotaxis protein [Desulfobacteraceae bacterium]
MKRYKSIGFKLVAGGILVVLIPLLIVGLVSVNKASNALTALSKTKVQDAAKDLGQLTYNILAANLTQVKLFSEEKMIVETVARIDRGDAENPSQLLSGLYQSFQTKFSHMGGNYFGIFVTDSKGNGLTGVKEGGAEYKGFNVADRDYFKKAVGSGRAAMGNMVRSKSTGKLITVACAPLRSSQGDLVGTVAVVTKAKSFTNLIKNRKIGTAGYGFMADNNGMIVAHPVEKHILTLNMNNLKGMEGFVKKMLSGRRGVEEYTFNNVDKIAGYAPVGINDWYIATTQDANEFLAAAHAIRNSSLLIGAIAIAITIAVILVLSRAIVSPLNKAVEGLKDIAEGEGDLTMRLPVTSQDEIGALATWFNTFIDKLQEIIRQIGENAASVSESSTELSAIAGQMSTGADNTASRATSVAGAAEEMSANLGSVAAAMEESSTNTTMVAAASEEMTSTINEIAQNAEKARAISTDAVDKSTSASGRMAELGKAAQAIGKVTETITDISEQTNLLALNATIEAARAGEAGRGFAVVANEIKALALQTAKATLDIKTQIEGVQQSTAQSLTEIEEISNVITGVNDIVATIAAAVEEQSSATEEIANNISQASQGIQEVNENISQSSSVAEEITRDITQVNTEAGDMSNNSSQVELSAEHLNEMSTQLSDIVGRFKV